MARKSKKNARNTEISTEAQEALAMSVTTEIATEEAVLDATVSAEEITAVLEDLNEVQEIEAVGEPEEDFATSDLIDNDGETFEELTGKLDPASVDLKVKDIALQVTQRDAFENDKSTITGKSNIHRTLKNVRSNLVRSHAARVMMAANVNEGFINRTLHDGSRYNVYALGKFADLVDALTGNTMSNAINIAIVRTMFAIKNAGLTFTKEIALAAASDKIRAPMMFRPYIVAHTVSASTAPTQASSTMQALETLGVVKITGGTRKNPSYEICNNAQSKALEEVAESLAA